ncbi:MAG: dienelactone hydrolase family protein [Salinarimonadaceae bacterium]|nr:MAG: dienelactone hydrolase family protein [Salinarimonadaceae bacterium]
MSTVNLEAEDGHRFSAYRAGPEDARFGLVVAQEIFGVNDHIRSVCDRCAEKGYAVIAPALFDRAERGAELGYAKEDVARGMELRKQVPEAGVLADIAAAAKALGSRPLGIVGFCWGGTLAWQGATRMDLFRAAVGWYGGGIAATRTAKAHCPVQLHFGELDHAIPLSDVEAVRQAQPDVEVYVYEGAAHGFGCDARGSFHAPSAEQAWARTHAFLERHLAAAGGS